MKYFLATLAVSHHAIDAILDGTNASKRTRLLWAGIGVGWAGFHLIRNFNERVDFWDRKLNG